MQAVTSSLIAALLLAHGVLGCCWQHVHVFGANHHPAAAACDCCDCRDAAGEHDSAPVPPCDCRWECHALCVYVPERSSLESPLAGVAEETSFLTAPVVRVEAGAQAGRWIGGQPPIGPPGARLHLLHQVLLI